MTSATSLGLVIGSIWPFSISTIVDPARSDIRRCNSGMIVLSSVAIAAQLGLSFHAAIVLSYEKIYTLDVACDLAEKAASASSRPLATKEIQASSFTRY